jgi:hypothetical protein
MQDEDTLQLASQCLSVQLDHELPVCANKVTKKATVTPVIPTTVTVTVLQRMTSFCVDVCGYVIKVLCL